MGLIALIIIISITRSGKKTEPLSAQDLKRLADLKAARQNSEQKDK